MQLDFDGSFRIVVNGKILYNITAFLEPYDVTDVKHLPMDGVDVFTINNYHYADLTGISLLLERADEMELQASVEEAAQIEQVVEQNLQQRALQQPDSIASQLAGMGFNPVNEAEPVYEESVYEEEPDYEEEQNYQSVASPYNQGEYEDESLDDPEAPVGEAGHMSLADQLAFLNSNTVNETELPASEQTGVYEEEFEPEEEVIEEEVVVEQPVQYANPIQYNNPAQYSSPIQFETPAPAQNLNMGGIVFESPNTSIQPNIPIPQGAELSFNGNVFQEPIVNEPVVNTPAAQPIQQSGFAQSFQQPASNPGLSRKARQAQAYASEPPMSAQAFKQAYFAEQASTMTPNYGKISNPNEQPFDFDSGLPVMDTDSPFQEQPIPFPEANQPVYSQTTFQQQPDGTNSYYQGQQAQKEDRTVAANRKPLDRNRQPAPSSQMRRTRPASSRQTRSASRQQNSEESEDSSSFQGGKAPSPEMTPYGEEGWKEQASQAIRDYLDGTGEEDEYKKPFSHRTFSGSSEKKLVSVDELILFALKDPGHYRNSQIEQEIDEIMAEFTDWMPAMSADYPVAYGRRLYQKAS